MTLRHLDDAQDSVQYQDDKMREFERRFGLRGREVFQGWYLLEELHDQNEDVEVKRKHDRDCVSPAPARTRREHRRRENSQRDEPKHECRRHAMKRKKK